MSRKVEIIKEGFIREKQSTRISKLTVYGLLTMRKVEIYILTKREGRTGRILVRGLDSTNRAQRGPYKKDQGPIFSSTVPSKLG